ncbi:MAG TPA: glycerol-3-phosphate 1-O-acyltransferase PlsY [Chloroflexota bacterium]|nr:glycerol-3-phosphate 1-O-acyltransferase PlsY [Chloroflexota bacterium]
MNLLSFVAVAVAAYLLGSFPSGVVLARLRGNVDILNKGSKRTGATNVLRTMGWKAAAPVFAMDFVKGILAVAAARIISGGDPYADVIAGLAALLGHNYSLFIRFRGGRGVTTGLGAVAVISPVALLVAAVIGVVIVARTRYVSLGSVVGAGMVPLALLPLVLAAGQPFPHLMFGLLGSAFIIASHRDNIGRLLHGTERKLGERA